MTEVEVNEANPRGWYTVSPISPVGWKPETWLIRARAAGGYVQLYKCLNGDGSHNCYLGHTAAMEEWVLLKADSYSKITTRKTINAPENRDAVRSVLATADLLGLIDAGELTKPKP